MDPSEPDAFVDHVETILYVPIPRQLSASKAEIIPAEEEERAEAREDDGACLRSQPVAEAERRENWPISDTEASLPIQDIQAADTEASLPIQDIQAADTEANLPIQDIQAVDTEETDRLQNWATVGESDSFQNLNAGEEADSWQSWNAMEDTNASKIGNTGEEGDSWQNWNTIEDKNSSLVGNTDGWQNWNAVEDTNSSQVGNADGWQSWNAVDDTNSSQSRNTGEETDSWQNWNAMENREQRFQNWNREPGLPVQITAAGEEMEIGSWNPEVGLAASSSIQVEESKALRECIAQTSLIVDRGNFLESSVDNSLMSQGAQAEEIEKENWRKMDRDRDMTVQEVASVRESEVGRISQDIPITDLDMDVIQSCEIQNMETINTELDLATGISQDTPIADLSMEVIPTDKRSNTETIYCAESDLLSGHGGELTMGKAETGLTTEFTQTSDLENRETATSMMTEGESEGFGDTEAEQIELESEESQITDTRTPLTTEESVQDAETSVTTQVALPDEVEEAVAGAESPEGYPVEEEGQEEDREKASPVAEESTPPAGQKFVTTIYTQRLSGRSSRSSDSGSDLCSPTDDSVGTVDTPVFGSRDPASVESPTEVCSVQLDVTADVASNTTTAFSKLFTKTVDTDTEVIVKERHLSECSISVGGDTDSLLPASSTNADQASEELSKAFSDNEMHREHADADVFATEGLPVKSGSETGVVSYSPGLAIRTLAWEDLQEKRLSPERELPGSGTPFQQETEASPTSLVTSFSSSTSQSEFFSTDIRESAESVSPLMRPDQAGATSTESSTSLKSSFSTTITSSSTSSSFTSSGQILAQCTEESAVAFRKPLFNPIEVERKFTIAEDTEDRLKALGARLHKEKVFTDVYFDNADYALILSDCWLRRRNDCWEAKIPRSAQNPNALFAPASQYMEISKEKEISAWLVDCLGLDAWLRGDPIDLLIQAAGLTEFARFTTFRRSYTLPTCVVDLDLTDHGFHVGEIEVMSASPEEVPHALQIIDRVAGELGVDQRDRPRGKMSLYLSKFNPQLYHKLVAHASSIT